MVSGVVVVWFEFASGAPAAVTLRVLVLNARDLQDALFRAVKLAIEQLPAEADRGRASVKDFRLVEFDVIA